MTHTQNNSLNYTMIYTHRTIVLYSSFNNNSFSKKEKSELQPYFSTNQSSNLLSFKVTKHQRRKVSPGPDDAHT